MGSPASVLENALKSIFKQMKNMDAGGDTVFEVQVPAQTALFAMSYLVTVPGSPPVKVPIAAVPSVMQGVLKPSIKAIASMDAGGDKAFASALANSINTMCQSGASSVGGTFIGAPNVPTLLNSISNAFNTKDDAKIANGIAKAVESYLKASGAS